MKTGFNIIFIPLFPNNLFELGTLSNEKAITVANFFNELSTKKKNLSECFYKGLFLYFFFLHFFAVRYNNLKLCLPF